MAAYKGPVKLVILDIAGTVCDGPQDLRHLYPNDDGLAVKGPVIVFDQMFQKFGMDVDWPTIRKPMGRFKREHLADIMAFDHVSAQYRMAHGRDYTETDLDEMFDMFRPIMAEVAISEDLIRPFDGLAEAIAMLQTDGVLVGCDTGYPKETCESIYATLEQKHNIRFDVVADSENVRGRPTPFLVYDCMYKANVFPPAAVIKADDITAGVQEGANSGAWTVGICETGAHDAGTLKTAGAHFTIPGAKDLPELIATEINPQLAAGNLPGQLSG